jgi:FtsH-binding integral membrane protein
MLFGATFLKLELFSNGSGSACYSYTSLYFGRFGLAAIAAAGPLGPILTGSISLLCSKNNKATEFCLWTYSTLLIASILKWVRPLDSLAFWIIVLFAILLTWIAYKGSNNLRKITLQTLAIQSFMSLYYSVGYLFSEAASVAGGNFPSDTKVIENNLFLPHWFWAGIIILVGVTVIYSSIKKLIKDG